MRSCFVVALVVSCVACGLIDCARGFPTEPASSWVYPYLDELRLRRCGASVFVSTGPYERREIAQWLDAYSDSVAEGGARSAYLYRLLRTEFGAETACLRCRDLGWIVDTRIGSDLVTEGRLQAEGFLRLALYSESGFCLWTTLRSTVNAPERHKIETVPWGDRARASFDNGGIGFRKGHFSLFLGRDELSWGASRQDGLLFSGSAPSLDMVRFRFATDRLCFTTFHSHLRSGACEEWGGGLRRFVAGHRLEVVVGRTVTFGVSEAVVYGGEGRTLEAGYFSPFTVFYAEQWNSEQDDNILIGGDLSVLMPGHAEIRGEIMIDDFQYDLTTEPHEFAAGLTATAINPVYPEISVVGASYFHVRNRTYGHLIDHNRFTHEGSVMGYPDGPDGDRLRVWSSLAFPDPVLWTLDYVFKRKGEGEATDSLGPTGPKVKFPSGTVETRNAIGVGLVWRPAYEWWVGARLEWSEARNADHIAGRTRRGLTLTVGGCLSFRLASNWWNRKAEGQ